VSNLRLRWSSAAAIAGLLMIVPAGCAVRGGGVAYDGGYGADYYDSYGADYGGWGDGYYVGPYRNGGYRGGDGGRGGSHAYRPASGGRGTPSIPTGSRGGGGRGGGRR
jgi:squid-like protein/heterogeneous nuclear ribonucleoprotein A1/A3